MYPIRIMFCLALAISAANANAQEFDSEQNLLINQLLDNRQECLLRCSREVNRNLDICADTYFNCMHFAGEKTKRFGKRDAARAACETEKDACIDAALTKQLACIARCE